MGTMNLQRIEARPFHCGAIVRRMRFDHRVALAQIGLNAHRELRDSFDRSYLRYAWLLDGRLVAIAGIIGQYASSEGSIWMVLTEEITLRPRVIVKEIRRVLDEAMSTKTRLDTTVLADDEAALRLVCFLGFHAPDVPGAAYTKRGRAALKRHLEETPDYRHYFGTGYAVGLEYTAEAPGV